MKIINFYNKKIAVVGLGKSGVALLSFLLKQKPKKLVGFDQKEKEDLEYYNSSKARISRFLSEAKGSYRDLNKMNLEFFLGKDYLKNLENFDLIFLSPGVPKDLPEIKKAQKKGTEISSEIKLFFELCPAKIIGVTGTNGKTTTTALVGEILKSSKVKGQSSKLFVGGNIGEPLIDKLDKIRKNNLVVLELSSFQLEDLKTSPHVAVVLNITPDHLDRHPSFNAYIEAKKNIILHQRESDFAVLNFDNLLVYKFRELTKAKIFGTSKTKELNFGTFIKNGKIEIKNGKIHEICKISQLKLIGSHNLDNVLAAVGISYLCGVSLDEIKRTINNFAGLEHRLELVSEIRGIKYYNDSKATTPESTIAAINSFKAGKTILIAGGYDKKADFSKLANEIKNCKIKSLVLIGATAKKIENSVSRKTKKIKIIKAESLKEAVIKAKNQATFGDVILLSPACASYDMFKNYEDRGRQFKELVSKLLS